MPYIYLAEPIDFHNEGMRYSSRLRGAMLRAELQWYSPADAWQIDALDEIPPEVWTINEMALRSAAVMAAVLPTGVTSVGVPLELKMAEQAGIPRFVLTENRRSVALAHMGCHLFNDPIPMVNAIMEHLERPRAVATAEALFSTPIPPGLRSDDILITPTPQGGWAVPALQAKWSGDGMAPKNPSYPGDAGYDLTTSLGVTVQPYGQCQVPCGIAIQLPPGYWGLIQGRSSAWTRRLSVKASVMDNGYRGPVFVDVLNLSNQVIQIREGERIAQLIPMPLAPPMLWQHVDQLDESERGHNGYGSSGK